MPGPRRRLDGAMGNCRLGSEKLQLWRSGKPEHENHDAIPRLSIVELGSRRCACGLALVSFPHRLQGDCGGASAGSLSDASQYDLPRMALNQRTRPSTLTKCSVARADADCFNYRRNGVELTPDRIREDVEGLTPEEQFLLREAQHLCLLGLVGCHALSTPRNFKLLAIPYFLARSP